MQTPAPPHTALPRRSSSRAARSAVAAVALCAGLASALATRPASAEENRYNLHVELGPLFNIERPVNLVRVEDTVNDAGVHLRLSFEYAFNEWVGLDVGWQPVILTQLYGGGIDTAQRLLIGARARPFWNHHPGYVLQQGPDYKFRWADLISDAWVDLHPIFEFAGATRVGFDIGVGTRVALYWPVQLGIFVRFSDLYAVDGSYDKPNFKQIAFGVSLDLGFKPIHAEADTDGDGVVDSVDRCPDTARGTFVNAVGCETKKETSPPPRCSDTDLDGVCDGSDTCPETPLGTQVDANGCPVGTRPEPE